MEWMTASSHATLVRVVNSNGECPNNYLYKLP